MLTLVFAFAGLISPTQKVDFISKLNSVKTKQEIIKVFKEPAKIKKTDTQTIYKYNYIDTSLYSGSMFNQNSKECKVLFFLDKETKQVEKYEYSGFCYQKNKKK